MKYPKVRSLGHRDTDGILSMGEVVLLEKIDGANFRFHYDREADAILFGARRQLFKEYDDPAPIERVNKQFRHAVEHVLDRVDLDALAALDDEWGGLWFFGESLHKHSIDYAWDGKHPDADDETPNYLGFDVYSEAKEEFLPHEMVEEIHASLGLETVPVVAQGDASEFEAEDIEVSESAFREPDPDADDEFNQLGLAEGVVIKNVSLDLRAKVVHESFAETKWSKSDPEELREARETAGVFINRFVTDARVQKQAHKLLDEGRYDGLAMEMMADIPRRVAEDVFAEQGWEILNNDEMELTAEAKEEIRSQLSRRCSRVLRQMMKAEA